MSDPLLAKAALRRLEVEVEGEKVIVRELTFAEATRFQDLRGEDHDKAVAHVLHRCVILEDGSPRFTEAQAVELAGGAARLGARLLGVITTLGSPGAGGKKNA